MDTKQDSNSSSSKPTVTDLPPVRQQPDECRLWIGNLDLRITEYAMLKLLQRYDITIRSLDFIYHRAGPEKGQPRGYCFVTLSTPAEAAMILSKLNGKMALSRRLVVKYADLQKRDRPADAAEISLGGTPQPSADVATTSKSARLDVKGKIDVCLFQSGCLIFSGFSTCAKFFFQVL